MRKPKIGFLSLTCPTHIDAFNENGSAWVDTENLSNLKKVLLHANLDLVDNGKIITNFNDLISCEKMFSNEDVDLIFLYIATWNWADQVCQFVRNMMKPVLIYTFNDSKAWSIGGLAATHGGLDEIGLKNTVVYGDINDQKVLNDIVSYSKACMVKNILKKSRYGSIGGQGMGIISGIIDPNQWLKDFGIITGFVDQYRLVIESEKISEENVRKYYDILKKEYKFVPEYNDIFNKSIRLYLALEKVIEQEAFDFTGVKCTFDLSDNYCSACLAQSRLSKRGFASACLNDSNGALSVYILTLLNQGKEPIFTADVNLVDKNNNIIKLIDDGSATPDLALNPGEEAELGMQPKLEAKAGGICTKLFAKPGKVNLIRLARLNSKYVLHYTEGEISLYSELEKEEIYKECGYPMWPHALVKIKGSSEKFIYNLRSEYIHMTYGDYKQDIINFCELFDMALIEN